jgi:hypothetical protein
VFRSRAPQQLIALGGRASESDGERENDDQDDGQQGCDGNQERSHALIKRPEPDETLSSIHSSTPSLRKRKSCAHSLMRSADAPRAQRHPDERPEPRGGFLAL